MKYVLSQSAEEDLVEIYIAGVQDFGLEQAQRYHQKIQQTFEFLAENPFAASERTELKPAIRIHPTGAHIVIYTVLDSNILILRVRHGREDWLNQ